MFSKRITDSDAFIAMPSSAQALYFHLNQAADDDGFNNQIQTAMMKSHASIDDVKMLLMKRFIIQFESGVIVIKHWRMHNTLRKDRYTPTAFQEEFAQLHIKENQSYSLPDNYSGCQVVAERLPSGCRSIGKVSIGKINPPIPPQGEDGKDRFSEFWKAYPKKVGKGAAEKSFQKIHPSAELLNSMIEAIKKQKQSDQWQKDGGQYIPNPATWLNQKRWEDELSPTSSSSPTGCGYEGMDKL